eukprot:scaffold15009_cov152-Isochrysis_galbana.AAC.2
MTLGMAAAISLGTHALSAPGEAGSGALDLEGGTLFSYFYSEVRTRGNNRVKVAAFLTPVYSRNAQQMFE